ncbi:MAG: roadblock/LC7 domain-containing protein [Actinobacteria bacterium]|nr:MAG: roadblock/LC7 domain-containing protein [Actinomycetota bacterium]RIK08623.1 MAG: dynein regulation protein LC7 [Acidobacteriota bacterium]
MANFVRSVPGVAQALALSDDGLVMARCPGLGGGAAERLSAVASALSGLAWGAVGQAGGGRVENIMVVMENALLLVSTVADGSQLAVVAAPTCDVDLVAYEMGLLSRRCGEVLTPEQRANPVEAR